MTGKKCPKCGSGTFQLVDYCVMELIYDVRDGVVEAMGRGDDGNRLKTTCVCGKCGHTWHPHKIHYTIDK